MADVDKSLPNVEQTVVIEPQKEIVQEEIVEQKGPVEITPTDDGGAEVTFDPRAVNQPGTEKHFDNLAELLPDQILDRLGGELFDYYQEYRFPERNGKMRIPRASIFSALNMKREPSPFGARVAQPIPF